MDILVFVTNVADKMAVSKVKPLLTAVPAIKDWNFDLDDCDRILRIVSNDLNPRKVEIYFIPQVLIVMSLNINNLFTFN